MHTQLIPKENPNFETERPLRVFISVGEASGDEHAAGVVRSLLKYFPTADIFGMGGSALRAAGMDTVVDSETEASVMGLTEVAGSLGRIVQAFRTLVRSVRERSPDVVVLVDFPDFNLRLARALHPHCRQIVYFISPQLWAWRRGRISIVRRYISKVIPIFPFEEPFYAAHGIEAKFVGHPFADRDSVVPDREHWMMSHGLNPGQPLIALLPGSRRAEVERLAPVISEAVRQVRVSKPSAQVVVAVAPTLEGRWLQEHFIDLERVVFVAGAREVLAIADAAIVASGTATVEAALSKVPLVVIYKLSSLTYAVGKLLVRGVKFIAMPNLVARKEIVRELLQGDCTPEAIAQEVERILDDPYYREQMRRDLSEVCARLEYSHDGPERTVDRVALLIAETARPVIAETARPVIAETAGPEFRGFE